MKVLVSGSTGFIGSALVRYLTTHGHKVVPLVRSDPAVGSVRWDPAAGTIEREKLAGLDAAVHLAGENIASGRWTAAKKNRLLNSRVQGTTFLSESLAKLDRPPRVLVSTSAVGYYGHRGDEWLLEDSPAGVGFLADVCQRWEAATEPAAKHGIRVARMRMGIVLAAHGGVLGRILLPFRLGVGGRLGSGHQYMSWISLDDACAAFEHALQTDHLHGPVNTVSPNPVTNLEFTKTLGRVISRPTLFPVPAAALKLVLGDMADELLLSSSRVAPGKLLHTGFKFNYEHLERALKASLKN